MSSSTRTRIWFALSSSMLLRFLIITYNFFVVPILLINWGITIYGDWLVLTAFITIVNLSNVGFVQASVSEMILRVSSGEHQEANRVFSTTIVSLCALTLVALGLATMFCFGTDLIAILGVHDIDLESARVILLAGAVTVLLGFFNGPLSSALGAVKGAAVPTTLAAVGKCVELAAIVGVVLAGGTPFAVAIILVFSAAGVNLALWILLRRHLPWLRLSRPLFQRATFQRLLHPSLGQLIHYVTVNVMAIQVPRIVLEHLGGPATVAVYSVSVTYTRSLRAFVNIISQSLFMEFSRAYAEGRIAKAVSLVNIISRASVSISAIGGLALVTAASSVFAIWTHRQIPADLELIILLTTSALMGTYSNSLAILLANINRVWTLALTHVAATTAALMVGFATFPRHGANGMAASLIFPELATATACVYTMSQTLRVPVRWLLLQSLQPPIGLIWQESTNLRAALIAKLWRRYEPRQL